MKKTLFLVVFILSLSAARGADNFRVVSIQILKPAKQSVSFDGRSVAIYATQYVSKVSGENYTFRNDTAQSRAIAISLKTSLEEWDVLQDYDIPVYDFYAFCERENCDDNIQSVSDYNLLIAVKEVSISADQRIERKYSDDYGNYFLMGMYAPYKVVFEIYDVEKDQFLCKETLADTLVWEKSVLDINKGLQSLTTKDEATEYAIEEIGKLFAQRLLPYWTSVERFFFVPSGRDFTKAAEYAENSQWDEAMKIWEQYAGSNNRRAAAQSAFNMALVCEINGNYELALEWLAFAEKTYSIQEIGGYRRILQRRINESKVIEEQLQDL